jgi:hypothetical protein
MAASQIHCLFHSSTSVVALLNSSAGQPLAGDLLVECAPAPALGFALSLETPVNYPGLAGLLGGVDAASLAHTTDRLPAPIVLAPGAAITASAMRTALNLLPASDANLPHLTLLVPLEHAPAMGATLALASRFTIAWDVAEFPHEELLNFARWLGREHLIDPSNFAGVLAYSSQPLPAAQAQRLTSLLAPLATATHPAGVTILEG